VLHEDLVPFLWPEQAESSAFWTFVKAKGSREAEVWSDKIVSTKHEGRVVLTLLKGVNLIGEDKGTLLAPGVLPPAVLLYSPELYVKECRFNAMFVYAALPLGRSIPLWSIYPRKTGCRWTWVHPMRLYTAARMTLHSFSALNLSQLSQVEQDSVQHLAAFGFVKEWSPQISWSYAPQMENCLNQ
jgi:hypothetical protein